VGIPRLEKVLNHYDAKATFFVPAVAALTYPEEQRRLAADGHEIALHGWIHETNSNLSYEDERDLLLRSREVLENIVGRRPIGMRTPSWELSPGTLRIAQEASLLYDSSLMADDDCYELLLDGEPSDLVEIPVAWARNDGTYFLVNRLMPLRPYTPPEAVFDIFRREFDAAYEQGGVFQLTCHPHLIGCRSRVWIIEELIRHANSRGHVWFATHADIASWVKQNSV
jgi:peptidoglycan/xylan/chitin deacetylase (PgdA/CDA1 family)